MTKHDLRRLRWLREAERELQPFHARSWFSRQPRRVVHRDEQRRAVEDVAVPRGRPQGAARADPSAPPRRRRGHHPRAARRRRSRASAAGRRRCCSRLVALPAGRSAACRSIPSGTRRACAWKSSADRSSSRSPASSHRSDRRCRVDRDQAMSRRSDSPGIGSGDCGARERSRVRPLPRARSRAPSHVRVASTRGLERAGGVARPAARTAC